MPCEEKSRMALEYQEASAAFDKARKDLQASIGTLSKEQYITLSHSVDKAWGALQRVHIELDEHIRWHSCVN
jgi:hypothetical protein